MWLNAFIISKVCPKYVFTGASSFFLSGFLFLFLMNAIVFNKSCRWRFWSTFHYMSPLRLDSLSLFLLLKVYFTVKWNESVSLIWRMNELSLFSRAIWMIQDSLKCHVGLVNYFEKKDETIIFNHLIFVRIIQYTNAAVCVILCQEKLFLPVFGCVVVVCCCVLLCVVVCWPELGLELWVNQGCIFWGVDYMSYRITVDDWSVIQYIKTKRKRYCSGNS